MNEHFFGFIYGFYGEYGMTDLRIMGVGLQNLELFCAVSGSCRTTEVFCSCG